jgi:hypothetical protein
LFEGTPRAVPDKHFLDEPSLEELLQLHSDRPLPLLVEAAEPLLHGAGVR